MIVAPWGSASPCPQLGMMPMWTQLGLILNVALELSRAHAAHSHPQPQAKVLLILQPGALPPGAAGPIPGGRGALLPFTAACAEPPGRPRPCSACMKSGLERARPNRCCVSCPGSAS